MKRILAAAVSCLAISGLSAKVFAEAATTNRPPAATTNADLEKARAELAVEKARLEMERAKFEAEKAKWDAELARLQAAAAQTNTPAPSLQDLHITVRAVSLYIQRKVAGELPAGTVVDVIGSPSRDWSTAMFRGRSYDVDATALASKDRYLGSIRQTAASAAADRKQAEADLKALRARREQLVNQIAQLRATQQPTIIVTQPRATSTNQPDRVMVVSDNSAGSMIAEYRQEARELEKKLDAIEKKLPRLIADDEKATAALKKAEYAFDAYKPGP